MSYKSTLQEHNILLQQAIDKANSLPDASGGSAPETCEVLVEVVSVNATSGDYQLGFAVETYDESTGETGISTAAVDASVGNVDAKGFTNVVVGGMISLFWLEPMSASILNQINFNYSGVLQGPLIAPNGRGAGGVFRVAKGGTVRFIRNG